MTRAEKALRIQEILDRLHPEPPIPLGHGDPFTLLVAVVLSAQCTDERVNVVTPGLFARARTPRAMAQLSEREILHLIRSCGLAPSKARALKRLSEILVAEHGGRVPADFAALEALPGVGHKTASVVMAQAFGVPAFPVDTHIHRLAARWGLSSGRNVIQTERDLKRLFPSETWGKVHLQLIHFGRTYCPARGHSPESCPVCAWAMPRSRRETASGSPQPRRDRTATAGAAGPRRTSRVSGARAATTDAVRKRRTRGRAPSVRPVRGSRAKAP
jgi:endonuclease-3